MASSSLGLVTFASHECNQNTREIIYESEEENYFSCESFEYLLFTLREFSAYSVSKYHKLSPGTKLLIQSLYHDISPLSIFMVVCGTLVPMHVSLYMCRHTNVRVSVAHGCPCMLELKNVRNHPLSLFHLIQ